MMAEGSMRMLDPQTNEWVQVPYVREGTGMDYITANLVPPFPLSHGQTVTYQLEMAVDAEQDMTVTNGETSIGVTLTDPDNPMEGDRSRRRLVSPHHRADLETAHAHSAATPTATRSSSP